MDPDRRGHLTGRGVGLHPPVVVPTYVFVDDVQFPDLSQPGSLPTDKVFGFAGYVIDADGLAALLSALAAEKARIGLGEADPVKHSQDPRMGRVYRRHYGAREGPDKFAIATRNAFAISRVTLGHLTASGGRVLASISWPYSRTPARPELTRWAFENFLQRLGWLLRWEARPHASVIVAFDRPDSDALYESFADAVHHGRTVEGAAYHSGPLAGLGVTPALLFSSTPHSPPLQVADYVSRACRDFLAWCHDGRRLPELFVPLIPALHRDAAGRIHGRGFAIKPESGFTVDDKVRELEAAASSGGSS